MKKSLMFNWALLAVMIFYASSGCGIWDKF
jgi:hypothetical protein